MLLNHVVGAAEQRRREGEAERFGGLEIDSELDFCKQFDRQVGGFSQLATFTISASPFSSRGWPRALRQTKMRVCLSSTSRGGARQ